MAQGVAFLEGQCLLGNQPWRAYIVKALARNGSFAATYQRPDEVKDVLYDGANVVAHPHDPQRQAGQPRIYGGVIAAADILNKDPVLRDWLRDNRGVRAIEMEGAGTQTAAWTSGRAAMIVRGVCDYCDTNKNDDWQHYAALAAAAYARALVEVLPEEWFQ